IYGYVGLSKLIGGATLSSSYIATILYAAVRVVDGLLLGASLAWPISTLRMMQDHRDLILCRLRRVVRWAAFAWWLYLVLDLFAIRNQTIEFTVAVFTASIGVGPIVLSLWNLISFVLVIWVSFALSKLIRFVLQEDVYPNLSLPRGLP